MPTYISLLRYTPKGMETVKEGPNRVEAAKKAFKAFGAELKQFYLVMGQYDAIVISEGPDDETAAKLALAIGSLGNIRTETMRAFTEDEFRKIIAGLP
ncbi:MAG: GYD domain-containing protein [Deltaproteobacteria bacterium]|nr:GYD domain-containing protein [Deltaproteobacteria bacterium]